MRRLRWALVVVLLTPMSVGAQVTWALPFPILATVPPACTVGDTLLAKVAGTMGLYVCTGPNVWTQLGWSGSGSLPAGAIVFVAIGTCPPAFSELADLNGKLVRGTVAANGNVGQSGSSNGGRGAPPGTPDPSAYLNLIACRKN